MDLGNLLQFVIWIAVIGGVFYLVWWLISFIGLPEPFNKIARIIVAIVAVVILIQFLLGALGGPPTLRLR